MDYYSNTCFVKFLATHAVYRSGQVEQLTAVL